MESDGEITLYPRKVEIKRCLKYCKWLRRKEALWIFTSSSILKGDRTSKQAIGSGRSIAAHCAKVSDISIFANISIISSKIHIVSLRHQDHWFGERHHHHHLKVKDIIRSDNSGKDPRFPLGVLGYEVKNKVGGILILFNVIYFNIYFIQCYSGTGPSSLSPNMLWRGGQQNMNIWNLSFPRILFPTSLFKPGSGKWIHERSLRPFWNLSASVGFHLMKMTLRFVF